jgi:hypothetical protein
VMLRRRRRRVRDKQGKSLEEESKDTASVWCTYICICPEIHVNPTYGVLT